ncbi:hypothetical protein DY023_02530 [Microbacterium bovistercoris]|uniref:Amino acid transporter n=1 Tax=Microbacterium bovistercoris TaxID=2293570 RepID=A0A371NZ33_9MICO|nr:hypothetical protein [Microbacterium bovistercoris]REJ07860.1 hypothetical protein DY023_02530 [Microbacterium bovistercoris]
MHDAEFARLYGAWESRTPEDVRELFAGYPGVWWIAGGWALQAFTGVEREHEDIDPGILRGELPLLRAHVAGRLDLWGASSGALKPVTSDDPDDLLEGCGQVWARRGAADPWEYDILLGPGTVEEWRYKRDETVRMPMGEAVWEREGIRYLQPEIQLLYKAKGLRPKDEADFVTTLPFLDARRRGWLRESLERTLPGHPWATRL